MKIIGEIKEITTMDDISGSSLNHNEKIIIISVNDSISLRLLENCEIDQSCIIEVNQ